MVTLSISLPDPMKEFIDREMAQHGHASADDYIQTLLGREQQRLARKNLEAKILEGLEGSMAPLDRAEWDSIRREALEGLEAHEIRP